MRITYILPIEDIKHTTVSVTNGVGVQLRGGCASECPWFEKHRANPASRGIAEGEVRTDRPSGRRGTLRGIFKKYAKAIRSCSELELRRRETRDGEP